MYIYAVTHVPTGKFYLALSTQPKNTFDAEKNFDPYGEFEVYGNNGTRLKMVNVQKRIVAVAGDSNELAALAADMAKSAAEDPNFVGIKGLPAAEPKPAVAPKINPTT